MSATNATANQICPVCDARNSNISLFCAECGASMNIPAEGDTAAFTPVASKESDSQATAAFVPAANGSPSNATSIGSIPPRSTVTPLPAANGIPAAESPAPGTTAAVSPLPTASSSQPDLGMRGFWLGMIAALLILAVLMAWGWATLLEQGTRDAIQDFFGSIS